MRQRYADAARRWIGTPFFPGGRVRGAGCDCVGLLIGAAQEIGELQNYQPPPYPIQPAGLREAMLIPELERLGFRRIAEDARGPGDVVCFRIGKLPHHAGILVGADLFVHAIRWHGVILGDLRDSSWHKRLTGIWRAPWDS